MKPDKAVVIEQSLKNISAENCLKAYKQIMEYADLQAASAKLLADNNNYGAAISLLIISNEEAIKALVVFLEGHEFGLRTIPGFTNIFDNHRLRYLVSFLIVVMDILMEDFKKYGLLFFKDPAKIIAFLELEAAEMYKHFSEYLKSRYIAIKKEVDWFSNFDNARQTGFYTDSFSNIDNLINVSRITKEDFDTFSNKIMRINSGIKEALTAFGGDTELEKEQLLYLRDSFKEGIIYKEIGVLLGKIKYPNYDSYGSLHKFLEGMYATVLEFTPEEYYAHINESRTSLVKQMKKLKKPKKKKPKQ